MSFYLDRSYFGVVLAIGLFVLFVSLLPLTEAVHIVPLLLILIGLFSFKKMKRFEGVYIYLLVSLFVTVPIFISAVDAFDVEKTLIDGFRIGLYFLAGYVLLSLNEDRIERKWSDILFYMVLLICLIWSFDAILQYFYGRNTLGYEYNNHRVTGFFHPKMRIGIILAHLLPFVMEACRRLHLRTSSSLFWLLLLPVLFVILIGGSRSSWVVAFLALSSYFFFLLWTGYLSIKIAVIGLIVSIILFSVSYALLPQFQSRVDQTAKIFNFDQSSLNTATSNRGEVWSSAWTLFRENPANGIGQGAMASMIEERKLASRGYPHAHFFVLDVMMYAGTIGFIFYVISFFLMLYRVFYKFLGKNSSDFTLSLSAVLMCMPINTHWGIYSTLSSSIMCILIIYSFLRLSDAGSEQEIL